MDNTVHTSIERETQPLAVSPRVLDADSSDEADGNRRRNTIEPSLTDVDSIILGDSQCCVRASEVPSNNEQQTQIRTATASSTDVSLV